MVTSAQARNTAHNLMTRALELLDETGYAHAPIHLQAMIDGLTDAPIPRTIEEAEALLDRPEAQALQQRLDRNRGWQ